MNIATGSTYKRMGCCRRHLPTNSNLLSCSLLEHPAAAALSPDLATRGQSPKITSHLLEISRGSVTESSGSYSQRFW